MATKIEWTDEVWNPVTGCTPVSEGCKNCYARQMAQRLKGRYGYPRGNPFQVRCHPERLNQPRKWKKPRRVFVCSMGDLFHEDVPLEFIDRVLNVISMLPEHTFLMLTKRPRKAHRALTVYWKLFTSGYPFPNLWYGFSAETQEHFNARISSLFWPPASINFVSLEPLLGPVDILERGRLLDWVIVGGETGPGARPMDPDWVRAVRDQCAEAGIPFFFKQMAGKAPIPPDLMIREFPEV